MTGDRVKEIQERLDGISSPEWEPTPNMHGDPSVSERGRGRFGIVASLSTRPSDYGRGNMEFIANAPADIRFLLTELQNHKETIKELTMKKED